MNTLLWIVQSALALLSFAGGAYKLFAYAELAKVPATAMLSRGTWSALGAFEMACAVLLIVPTAMKWMPVLTPIAAAALAVESLVLAVLYARHSLQLTATNPLVWVLLMAVLAVIIAFGRAR
jgi:DoxX-like family